MNMNLKLLETVVLEKDIPSLGLQRGDISAVVELYEPDGVEIEFVKGSGETQALVTLNRKDDRPVADSEILAVRFLYAA
jgi:hypothetical protein